MNRSPAFQFYPDKWQSHTRRLEDSSYRVFHELICWMWQHSEDHCSIPASPEAVACAVAMPLQCVRIAMADIQNEFSPLLKTEGGLWVCNGLRKEQEKQKNRRQKAKENADARWNHADASNPHSKKSADASNPQCSPTTTTTTTPSPTPTTKNRNTHPQSAEDLAAGEIYQAYPRKVAKAEALKAIKRAMKDSPVTDLLEITKLFAASQTPGSPYTPYAATWFNGKRYEDDPSAWTQVVVEVKAAVPAWKLIKDLEDEERTLSGQLTEFWDREANPAGAARLVEVRAKIKELKGQPL